MTNKNNNLFFTDLPDFEKQAEEAVRRKKMPATPTFSLEDMDEARKSTFEKGKEDGLQIAKDAIEQRTEILVQSIIENVHVLEESELARKKNYIENSVAITYKSIDKLLHAIITDQKEEMVKKSLYSFFKDHSKNTKLTIFIHPSMKESVVKYIEMLSHNIEIKTDDTLLDTQTRMEWIDGSFEFNPEGMIQSILDTIKDHIPRESIEILDESPKKHHTDDINQETIHQDDETEDQQ